MSENNRLSGAQFQGDRPTEAVAVRTTIVGGRPPGSGQNLGNIPRGLEVLLKKAAVDPGFKDLLLAQRAEAAGFIGLKLEPVEVLMLQNAPVNQLEVIIAQTRVPQEHRRAFLGQAAAAMLATLGVGAAGLGCAAAQTTSLGITSDRIMPAPGGAAPDRPPVTPDGRVPADRPGRIASIEAHVREVLAKLFRVDPKDLKPDTSLVEDLKATHEQLTAVKRQLEKDYRVVFGDQDFFKKVKTVDDLVKVVVIETAVQRPTNPEPVIKGIRPDPPPVRGIRPDLPSTLGVRPDLPDRE